MLFGPLSRTFAGRRSDARPDSTLHHEKRPTVTADFLRLPVEHAAPGIASVAIARRTPAHRHMAGPMDRRRSLLAFRLRRLPLPQDIHAGYETRPVRHRHLGRQPLPAVRQWNRSLLGTRPGRSEPVVLRDGGHRPVARSGRQRTGRRGMEHGRAESRGTDRPAERSDRTGRHAGRRNREQQRELARLPRRSLRSAVRFSRSGLHRRTGPHRRETLSVGMGTARIRRQRLERRIGHFARENLRSVGIRRNRPDIDSARHPDDGGDPAAPVRRPPLRGTFRNDRLPFGRGPAAHSRRDALFDPARPGPPHDGLPPDDRLRRRRQPHPRHLCRSVVRRTGQGRPQRNGRAHHPRLRRRIHPRRCAGQTYSRRCGSKPTDTSSSTSKRAGSR